MLAQSWFALFHPHAKIIESKNLRELVPERKHYIQQKFLCHRLDFLIAQRISPSVTHHGFEIKA